MSFLSGGGAEAARLVISLAVSNSGAMRSLGDVQGKLQSIGSGLKTSLSGPLNDAMTAFGNIGDAADGIRSVSQAIGGVIGSMVMGAAKLETFALQFEVLLGSADAAKARMADLAQFANTTPFELPGVVEASRLLQTFTDGALAAGDGLRMVGDVAAGTGKPIEDVAFKIGRMYDALRSGTNIGESLMYLQEMGAISGASRRKIEGLAEAVKSGAMTMNEAWAQATGEFGKFGGMTEKLAQSTEGKLSTAIDAVNMALAKMGEKFLPMVKSALDLVVPAMEVLGFITDKVSKYWFVIAPFASVAAGAFLKWAASTRILTGSIAAFGVSLRLLPIIGWITAIITVLELFSAAWENNFLGIRDIVEKVWSVLKTNFGWLFDIIGGLIGVLETLGKSFGMNSAEAENATDAMRDYGSSAAAAGKASRKLSGSLYGVVEAAEDAGKTSNRAATAFVSMGNDAAASGRYHEALGSVVEDTGRRIVSAYDGSAGATNEYVGKVSGVLSGYQQTLATTAAKAAWAGEAITNGLKVKGAVNIDTGFAAVEQEIKGAANGIYVASSNAMNGQVIAAEYQRKRLLAKQQETLAQYISAIITSRQAIIDAAAGALDMATATRTLKLSIKVGKFDLKETDSQLRSVNALIDQYDNARLTAKQQAYLKEQGLTQAQYLNQLNAEKAGLELQRQQQATEQSKRLIELSKFGSAKERMAALSGAATALNEAGGLRSGDVVIRRATIDALAGVYGEIEKLKNSTYGYGKSTMESYGRGIKQAGGFVLDAANNIIGQVRGLVVATSPPKASSPLHNIDTWGFKTGEAWAKGLGAGIATADPGAYMPTAGAMAAGLASMASAPAMTAALVGGGSAAGGGGAGSRAVGGGGLTLNLAFNSSVPYTPAEQTEVGRRVGPAVYEYLRSRGAV